MKKRTCITCVMLALGVLGSMSSCAEFDKVLMGISPEMVKTLPPPASVAGATIKIQAGETDSPNWITVKMKNNNSGTATGYDSTEIARYTVIDGRAYLYLSYTELGGGMLRNAPRIFTYTLDGELDAVEEKPAPRSAAINIQSVKGKEYYGVINGYLHNQYQGTTERLTNAPIVITVK